MRVHLLDVNVLVALTWPTHVHHHAARFWFDRVGRAGWATCPITQLGFVRVSSNLKAIPDAVRPPQAVAVLKRLTDLPGHHFWPDEVPVVGTAAFDALNLVGHRQVTDAYLVALAQHNDGKVATLDRSLPELVARRDQRPRWVEVIPAEVSTGAPFPGGRPAPATPRATH